ncbi:MAG: DegT/DnrJ/EryC1/StrS family aminotransferase [Candidatus Nitrosocaldus sp.]|nr:DegT/DnrJ/EryC1/StrS family aminotransferase [Candidatus Nitrosocaldus sp.]MDW8275066.1 DegT/DnrJ/EryC1/StrS family aminotransferase [Candidatus Nitrosocaldus sp.]
MIQIKVQWSVPDIGKDEENAVSEVIKSKWLGMGPRTKEFEGNICSFTGAKHCIVVNNGTSALITALLANNIGPGDEVLVPTYTFIATVNSVLAIGAKPILIDCDPRTFNISPDTITSVLHKHPHAKALIFVDVAGMPADIDAIREIAIKHNLVLIEDAAEAFGALYKNKMVGSFDHTTIFSFHIAKQMTMVEGGAIVAGDSEVAERCRLIRSHGEGKEKYIHIDIGLNFRPTDIQSAIGIAQLKKVLKYIALREKIAKIYMAELNNLLAFQYIPEYVTRHPWMLFMSLAKNRSERDALNRFLNERGIETRIPWPPAHIQPYHKRKLGNISCPNANAVYERILALPIGNAISESQAFQVVDTVKAFYKTVLQ